ncbi:hypothetical protein [Zunongwangia endophytica]|uniref:Uncharacterized protein n=1 Tax=Zunongwangia endophytica TaxID=1808945 RepID=A0ABV8H8W9_9FLAO|nr:hypothetical protein [Zunongwangia endophytica]MDN3595287.1 hypothetical protein [Zunongwangia endophytica]
MSNSIEINALVDQTLVSLYNVSHPDAYIDLRELIPHKFKVQERNKIDAVLQILINEGWINTANDTEYRVNLNAEGRRIFKEYGSYSSFLNSRIKSQTFKRTTTKFKEIIKMLATIVFGVSTLVLGWLNYNNDNTIDEQKDKITELELVIDSLQTNRPILINQKKDSLLMSSYHDPKVEMIELYKKGEEFKSISSRQIRNIVNKAHVIVENYPRSEKSVRYINNALESLNQYDKEEGYDEEDWNIYVADVKFAFTKGVAMWLNATPGFNLELPKID